MTTIGSLNPYGSLSPYGSPPRGLSMSIDYAQGRMPHYSESPLAVEFKRRSTAADGSAGPAQWWDHAAGVWANSRDPAAHLRRLDRDESDAREQSYAVPLAITEDPTAYALVHALGAEGEALSVFAAETSNYLYAMTRGPSAKP